MLFHMERYDSYIGGWLCPDNPGDTPSIVIRYDDKPGLQLETNWYRPDLVAVGLHPTGKAGFHIDEKVIPDIAAVIDNIDICDASTGITLYRSHRQQHISAKVFRFEMQAMPYAAVEAAWDRSFNLYYNAIERHPFETLFGILNNPVATSIGLSGRPVLSRYEQLLRDRDYKLVTLLRDPVEELAERLLFTRYVMSSDNASKYDAHLSDLGDLRTVTKRLNLEDLDSLIEAFSYLSDKQIEDLSNPLVKALACSVEDPLALSHHVEVALSRLSTFDLVGVRTHFDFYKSSLKELLGINLLGETSVTTTKMVERLSAELKTFKMTNSLLSLDLRLYELAKKAITRASTPSDEKRSPSLKLQRNAQ